MLGDKSKVRICGCSHEVARHKLVDVGGGVMKHAGACEHGCGCAGLHRRRRGGPTQPIKSCNCGAWPGNPHDRSQLHASSCPQYVPSLQGVVATRRPDAEVGHRAPPVQRPLDPVARVAWAMDEVRDALVFALTPKPSKAPGQLVEAFTPRPIGVGLFGPSAVLNRQPRERKPSATPTLTEGVDLPKGELAILTACAQHDGGCTRTQLTALTGYKASTRNTYIARLADKDLVNGSHQDGTGSICATKAGFDMLGPKFKKLPVGDELRTLLLETLPEGEGTILNALASVYPRSMTRDQISMATGYTKVSTRNAYIARLATKTYVECTTREDVVASKHLFGGRKKKGPT